MKKSKGKEYQRAKIEFICFVEQDIITTSGGVDDTPSGDGTIGTVGWDNNGWT